MGAMNITGAFREVSVVLPTLSLGIGKRKEKPTSTIDRFFKTPLVSDRQRRQHSPYSQSRHRCPASIAFGLTSR
jgi:hypothetical protein